MLDTRGNTAVYLQFAHARLASILQKAQDEMHVDLTVVKASPHVVSIEHDAERALAFELLMFSDIIAVSQGHPCRVAHALLTKGEGPRTESSPLMSCEKSIETPLLPLPPPQKFPSKCIRLPSR